MKNIFIIMLLAVLSGCSFSNKETTDNNANKQSIKSKNDAFIAQADDDYQRLGLQKGTVEGWEDGMRTTGKEGTYEWWYFDGEFENGITVVAVFYTKNIFDVEGKAWPTVTLDVTFPDGKKIKKIVQESEGTMISASKDICDVKIAGSYLKRVGKDYELSFKDEGIEFKAKMKSDIPMWRPKTGHMYFGKPEERNNYFAWVVAQPSSTIDAQLTLGNEVTKLHGHGYRDHNWGNISMNKLINNWYWGRGKIGDYNVIFSDIVAEKEYNSSHIPIMMIAKDGEVIADDENFSVIGRNNVEVHPKTGKFVHNNLSYILKDPSTNKTFTIEANRVEDIVVANLLDNADINPFMKWVASNILGKNPTYLRTVGDINFVIEEDGVEIYKIQEKGLWEQMFFGANKHPR